MRRLEVRAERFPVRGAFTISRSRVTEIEVVLALIEEDGVIGRGECRPYPRYGETTEGVMAAISGADLTDRARLAASLRAGAARNALDCALWDLEAKRAGQPVWRLAGLPEPQPLVTAFTISLDTPECMALAAIEAAAYPLLKLKLGGGEDDEARLRAVRAAAPEARLIVDANEAWTGDTLPRLLASAAEQGVELVEQPLPAGADDILAQITRPVPVCADESCHASDSLDALVGRYDAVNLKLDKTGGLTEALATAARARALGFEIMVGCMLATSLAMGPAVLLAQGARWVDLDGPLLLARDREPGLRYDGAAIDRSHLPLWG